MKTELEKLFLRAGAFFGFTGVALGAFGAHGLRSILPPEALATFETGVRYQMYHAFALLIVPLLARRFAPTLLRYSGWSFIAGTLMFSGSLYILSVTGIQWFGAITPLGGICFLAGWLTLFLAVASIKKES